MVLTFSVSKDSSGFRIRSSSSGDGCSALDWEVRWHILPFLNFSTEHRLHPLSISILQVTRSNEDATAFIKSVSEEVDSLHPVDDLNDECLSVTLHKVVETVGDDLWKLPFFGKFIDDGYTEPSFVAKFQYEALQHKVQRFDIFMLHMACFVCSICTLPARSYRTRSVGSVVSLLSPL